MSMSASDLAARLLAAASIGDDLACDCGRDVEIHSGTTVLDVETLIEHAAFDHPTRRSILVRRTSLLVKDSELGTLLGLG